MNGCPGQDADRASGGEILLFSGVTSFAGRASAPVWIPSTSVRREYVEIGVARAEGESSAPWNRAGFLASYSQCEAYREAIKSAVTVSRTIIPPEVARRFCYLQQQHSPRGRLFRVSRSSRTADETRCFLNP